MQRSRTINYTHAANTHSLPGAQAAFGFIARYWGPFHSLIDIGCGTGIWLRAAAESGVTDLCGVDGIQIEHREFAADRAIFRLQDFTRPFDIGRRFDAAICLEVAEHLPEACGAILVESICRASPMVFFSAACPWQSGQNHVNCQWPAYWQNLFNQHGFACYDDIRPSIWCEIAIEPWYRQNIFRAVQQIDVAGTEPRILPLVHPELCDSIVKSALAAAVRQHIAEGKLSATSYLTDVPLGLVAKVWRKFRLSPLIRPKAP